jgi:predicted nucleic acid-binding Zn ribbon protein
MRNRAPRPLAAAIRIARDRAAPQTPLAGVQQVWAELVGEQVAAVSEPVAERDGVIVFSCDSAVWAQELDLMQERFLTALRERLGTDAPRGLRFEARRG